VSEVVLDTLKIRVEMDSDDVSKDITGLKTTLSKLNGIASKGSKSVSSYGSAFSSLRTGATRTVSAIKSITSVFGSWFKKSNEFVESSNLFYVAMGNGAEGARKYAKEVERLVGINIQEWMNYQGSFNQLAEGYEITSDVTNKMSKNLTQMAYDLSSFWNTDVSTAFNKLQSGMSGQIKGLKAWGINLSVAQLRETALAHGIDLSTSKMTEAQKATLRYVTLMEHTTNIQGDLARTIVTPANSLRIMSAQWEQAKRTMGQAVSVIAVRVIPYFQALIQVITDAAKRLADFLGYELPEIDYSGMDFGASGMDDLTDSTEGAEKAVKELKKSLLGIDEINKLNDTSASTSSLDNGYDSTLGLDLGAYDYDFLKNIKTPDLGPFEDTLKKIATTVGTIAAGIASWEISKKLLEGIEKLKNIKGKSFQWSFSILGASMFLADLDRLRTYLEDISNNGFNFENVAGVLSEGAGLIGDALVMLGNLKFGGVFKVIQGIGEIVIGVSDIAKNGANIDNSLDVIRGLSNIAIAIGLFTGNIKIAGAAAAIQGLTTIIEEIATNWNAIKQGDWSGVDKASLVIGCIEVLGGILVAFDVLSKIKAPDTTKVTTELPKVTTAADTVSQTTSQLSTKMTSLMKNLGVGLVIIAEVAVAVGLVVGAVWGLGLMLDQMADAWKPVLDKYDTVTAALLIGVALMGAFGAAVGVLGTTGSAVMSNLAIGTATLAVVGVSVGLFLAEIWAIGFALNQIAIAWQPVLFNGPTITTAISTGTALLIGIGVVTAALGMATVASAGLLPLAIAMGTALLVELAAAFVLFCASLGRVATELTMLAPVLAGMSAILPTLKTDMDAFTAFMTDFAAAVIAFTVVSAIAGIAATVDTVISFFLTNPVERMYNEVSDQTTEFEKLIPALEKLNPMIVKATKLVGTYKKNMGSFESATGGSGGFLNSIVRGAKGVVNGLIGFFEGMANGVIRCINTLIRGLNKISFDVPDWVPGIGGKKLGFSISTISEVRIPRLADGGFPTTGQMFIAREAGPEMVGTIGNKSAVVNNEQIVAGISRGVQDANSEQNELLREQNNLLRALLEKDTTAEIPVSTIVKALSRKNQRDGAVAVPVGV